VSEPFLTDEEIAEFTTTHDWRAAVKLEGGEMAMHSFISSAAVIAYLRSVRDRAQAHMDTLLLAQAASLHDKYAAELGRSAAEGLLLAARVRTLEACLDDNASGFVPPLTTSEMMKLAWPPKGAQGE
jgi:hypothetical protein